MQASKYCLSVIIILLFVLIVHAEDSFFKKQDEGWFFYKERPEIEREKEVKKQEQQSTAASSSQMLFSEKMEKAGNILISRALENPTEENVKAYMEYNKAMLALSDNFSKVWQKLILKYPELLFDTNLKYAFDDVKKSIKELSKEAGLYFIYSSSCPACKKQIKVLKEFQEQYPSMVIFPITIDKPVEEFPNSVIDNGITQRFGITQVPTIIVYFPYEGKIEFISQGFIDKFELERGLFNYAQPVNNNEIKENINRILSHIPELSDN